MAMGTAGTEVHNFRLDLPGFSSFRQTLSSPPVAACALGGRAEQQAKGSRQMIRHRRPVDSNLKRQFSTQSYSVLYIYSILWRLASVDQPENEKNKSVL
jgi:hypothetical protein